MSLPPDELRSWRAESIFKHVEVDQRHRLQRVEKLESESWKTAMDKVSQEFPTLR